MLALDALCVHKVYNIYINITISFHALLTAVTTDLCHPLLDAFLVELAVAGIEKIPWVFNDSLTHPATALL